jgi:cytohesin
MKHLLLTTIAAVLVVGCGESQQSAPAPEAKPEPPTAKAPDISLFEAAFAGNIEAVKQAIAAGSDVNAKDAGGGTLTPLHVATTKEIAELLLANGADVNAKDSVTGATPLHEMAIYGQKEIVELLIAGGADVNANSDDDGTPLDWAIRHKHPEIADLLRKHGAKSGAEDSIYVAVAVENIEAVKQHLAVGADVNAKDAGGGTPLLVAASRGHKEIVELLIAEGADVNAKRTNGSTPLHYAALKGHKEIAELLIAEGANVNAKGTGSRTPLDLAIQVGNPKTADLLHKHGGKTKKELEAEGK